MIERPKRAVTRFFVPLIDVLILLFAIFLLMPFVATPEPPEADPAAPKAKAPEPELPKDVRELRAELERARREADKLRAERGNLAEHLSVKVLEIDPRDGRLYYLQDGQRVYVTSQAAADTLITMHKRASGTREPFFLILYPRTKSGYPEQQQADDYARWFKDVQFQFDRPFAPSP
jgi:biopolymer transport protein ExbD